jgi:hypothetical protein
VSPIDVWNVATFDDELAAHLRAAADLIRDYLTTSRRQYLEREASDHTQPYPINPYGSEYVAYTDGLVPWMQARSIRAWHYTRMTDAEAAALQRDGVHLSDLAAIRRRLDGQIAAGAFSADVAEALFVGSPFQSEQLESRSGKFWMVSHPRDIEDSGVELLLESWGGEAVYFWQRDPDLQSLLKRIGRPRVIELAVPLAATNHAYSAGRAVVSAYARTLGCHAEGGAFDLYARQALGPEAILKIHSEGDTTFGAIARGYPAGFSDPADIGQNE